MKKLKYIFILTLAVCFTQAQAQKIVTGGSSSTEIVCALGLCDNIVATDLTSTYPPQMQSLPSIGYRTGINTEGIISMAPDVIILEKEYVKDVVIEQLGAAQLNLVQVENHYGFEFTIEKIRTIAKALKREKEGEALIQNLQTDLESLSQRVAAHSERPKVLCVYNRGMGNMMVAGSNTGFDIISLAGVENAVPEIEGFKPLNVESLISTNPDYILFFESGLESIGGIEGALKIPGVAQTTAGRKKQIIAIDGVKLTNWGPRLAEAATELFDLTHQVSND
ncbi:MAG: ABC transporter substrate-binding protein [Cytophagia bacterium]|nr:ABC transporter substrate-binding protein [Cytophagia bacterium]